MANNYIDRKTGENVVLKVGSKLPTIYYRLAKFINKWVVIETTWKNFNKKYKVKI